MIYSPSPPQTHIHIHLPTSLVFPGPRLMMGLPQEKSGLAVLLRFTLLSSGGSDSGESQTALCTGSPELAPCWGEKRQLWTPCKIYECVLLIVLVSLWEDAVCLGLKQTSPTEELERRQD